MLVENYHILDTKDTFILSKPIKWRVILFPKWSDLFWPHQELFLYREKDYKVELVADSEIKGKLTREPKSISNPINDANILNQ